MCKTDTTYRERAVKLGDGIQPQLNVILSDINMPGMDGLTLLGEIKRRWPELTVMMVTAYGDDERRRTAHARGASDFSILKRNLEQLSSTQA